MSVSKSKRISASVRIAMSLCLVVCVIWNYAITSNIIRGNNSLCLGALMAATDALFSLPVETIPRKATNQRHDKDDEFAVCLKIMDANHELM